MAGGSASTPCQAEDVGASVAPSLVQSGSQAMAARVAPRARRYSTMEFANTYGRDLVRPHQIRGGTELTSRASNAYETSAAVPRAVNASVLARA